MMECIKYTIEFLKDNYYILEIGFIISVLFSFYMTFRR